MTQTICPECEKPIEASYEQEHGQVFFTASCPHCGAALRTLASEHPEDFYRWDAYESICVPPKQALTKGSETGKSECPLHCGTCEDHKMTACCVLIEVTQDCNQHCPVCYANAVPDCHCGPRAAISNNDNVPAEPRHAPTTETITAIYDHLLTLGEERPFNIQLSGGEPTVRNDLPEIIKTGREKGFEYIQLNTNGRRIAQEPGYAEKLAEAGLTTVFLQFDGMNDEIYKALRGEPLLEVKKQAVENCRKAGLPVTLVPTVMKSINLSGIGELFDYMLENVDTIKGIHFQPASFFGRSSFKEEDERVTMFGIMKALEEQTDGRIKTEDLVPISTGHPLCCFCGTFIKEANGSITSLTTEEQKETGNSCCCSAEPTPLDIIKKDRDFVLNKWQKGGGSTCDCSDGVISLDDAESFLRSRIFTISGMAFMDRGNLDAERLKRCRVQIYSPDKKLIPFCAYNTAYRV
jgi:uncharacterized radical SAM superfamily Fe-S cluster-containing enzyme